MLPDNVDAGEIKAETHHGVLTVRVPKKEVEEQPHKEIPVTENQATS